MSLFFPRPISFYIAGTSLRFDVSEVERVPTTDTWHLRGRCSRFGDDGVAAMYRLRELEPYGEAAVELVRVLEISAMLEKTS